MKLCVHCPALLLNINAHYMIVQLTAVYIDKYVKKSDELVCFSDEMIDSTSTLVRTESVKSRQSNNTTTSNDSVSCMLCTAYNRISLNKPLTRKCFLAAIG